MSVHVVTDSTSDLLPSDAERLGVAVVPLTLRFGEEQMRDGVDITPTEFYQRLKTSKVNPSTSQPTPAEFTEVYRRLLARPDDRVVSIHIAQRWSGTIQSATLAAQEFDGRVLAVDSGSVSAGMQFLVRAALRDIELGADADAVVRSCELRRGRVRVWVMLDTLTYLQRGGRIGRAKALVGGVFNIRPVLQLIDGEAHSRWSVRVARQGMERMLEAARAQGPVEQVALVCSHDHPLAGETGTRLSEMYPELELVNTILGPVVGCYAGPQSLGIGLLRAAD